MNHHWIFHHIELFNTEIEPTEDETEELAEFKVSKAMKLTISNKEDLSSFLVIYSRCTSPTQQKGIRYAHTIRYNMLLRMWIF